jgi:hypothetical protein
MVAGDLYGCIYMWLKTCWPQLGCGHPPKGNCPSRQFTNEKRGFPEEKGGYWFEGALFWTRRFCRVRKKGSGGDKYSLALGFLGFGGRWNPRIGLLVWSSLGTPKLVQRERGRTKSTSPRGLTLAFFLSFKGLCKPFAFSFFPFFLISFFVFVVFHSFVYSS